ncbi:aldehyde dehydrogenase family protein [Leucobacter massiliensis]|uniref:Aldehyde dehydrogenase n=1 Tax=Leucobacter massiliensis TaxID=1686285 RepID=A0A2S9QS75_9MICO|nr:aldehyde dehydrogenase family protein [Leucobacter massiliensis]PRI12444.1 aldehyde dehydrogenase [Leucobacter massiliensis]
MSAGVMTAERTGTGRAQDAASSPLPELVVTDPATGAVIGSLPQCGPADVPAILETAGAGRELSRALSRHRRAEILDETARLLRERAERFAETIVAEAGKTIRQARKEVARAANTIALSAAEARRGGGEVIPFDAFAGAEDRRGWFTREPLGIILAITPYNDALNLVAHKIGPAIAGGNSVILKPAQQTPYSARMLTELLRECGLPEASITVVHGDRELTQALVAAREVRMVSFTGGFRTGEAISRSAGIKKLAMELGGNAPVLVFADADVDAAVDACVSGAFWAAGQNCIGTQRILVHRSIAERFTEDFVARTRRLVTGDPRSETSDVGPMISPEAAARAAATVASARRAGATVHCGGEAEGPFMPPTVLTGVPEGHELCTEEVFAPVVIIDVFDAYEEAIAAANALDYALHAALFTGSLDIALRASAEIEAGGVMINDSSDFRIDAMPFGGAKHGSMGREGVRFAYEEMTQPKVVCLR